MATKYKRAIAWLRRDIRLYDHTALSHATHSSKEVVCVFCFDTNILSKLKDKNDRRLQFIHGSLFELDKELRALGSRLIILHGDSQLEIPKLAEKIKAEAIFANADYEPQAIKRDDQVAKDLKKAGINWHLFKDQVIFAEKELLNGSGQPFKVFTPYKNAWLKKLGPEDYQDFKIHKPALIADKKISGVGLSDWTLAKLGFFSEALWLATGTSGAKDQWQKFFPHLSEYKEARNYPALTHRTSGLSVHLRFGTISIRDLVRKAKKSYGEGADTWLSELIWRDFYQMILANFPYVEKSAFKQEYKNLRWPGKAEHFSAWCAGETGYPIIDAAMRCFNETGWMHNRLRMIVAMFLTKDLLIDWRWGEEYFARYLLDFDLAANNGGWQWSASTGCDAQPYFRIFNPISQSEKFDPEAKFIKKYCPELKNLSEKEIHFPEAASLFRGKYPIPIIDHAVQRGKALALFKKNA